MLKAFLLALSLTMPASMGAWQQTAEPPPLALPIHSEPPNLFPDQNKKVIGTVVLFDSSLSSHTSHADFVVKSESEGQEKYIRLLYAAAGFGFDAPAATPEQLVPHRMFSEANVI